MSSFNVHMLASSSKGNSALITTDSQCFLIDMGISCRQLVSRMKEVGCSPEDLSGIFITHEHTDHIKGLTTFLKKYKLPVYSSANTWRSILLKNGELDRSNCRVMEHALVCGGVEISSFAIPHDAVDPHGYCFKDLGNGSKFTYLTDTGFVTNVVREAVIGSDLLVLEANHDVQLLKNGSYPYALKQRILSTRGHLSNESAGWLLANLERLPEQVILAHLSEENNRPKLAHDTVSEILDSNKKLSATVLQVAAPNQVISTKKAQEANLFELIKQPNNNTRSEF